MSDPDKLRSDKGFLTYVPADGEQHDVLEVATEFEGRRFEELPKVLRVNTSGGLSAA